MAFERFRIGTRLGLGFAVVLALSATTILVGARQMGAAAEAVQHMMTVPLVKERLASEWFRNTSLGVRRTTALAKSDDDRLAAVFAEEIAKTTRRTNEIVKSLGEMAADDEEKAMLADISQLRSAFLGAREKVLAAKKDGKPAEADRLFDGEFKRSADAYLAAMQAYLDHQSTSIDSAGAKSQRDASRGQWVVGALGLLTLGLGAVLAWALSRSITRPIGQAAALAHSVASGDLTRRVEVRGSDEVADLLRALSQMRDGLASMVAQVRSGVEAVGSTSAEIASGNQDLSRRTEQAAGSLQQTAASMQQLTHSVHGSAQAAAQASQLAASAADVAQRGGAVVGQVVSTMDEINSSSKRIADIIGTIDGIAFQTNILALNAAVEAARAGEQGRGFAVVASEVRSLAQRSAGAAREIKTLIGSSVDKVETGARLVQDAGSTMGEIVASVQRVTRVIAEISSAAGEQSSDISAVNGTVGSLDQMTQRNAALVEQSAAAAASLRDQAGRLNTVVAHFRT
ncbi:MAG: HAMP domain-containing protein [Burkholderiaceae bacterium]|nr:HAMP domain-containing protein [Burkholderiaceae bacterium]